MKSSNVKAIPPACEQTANAVQRGEIHAGDMVSRLACEHLNDRSHMESETYFPFTFDESAASKAVATVAALNPSPLEALMVWVTFGWKRKDTGARRYKAEGF